ncbi:Uu.00g061690.m01.CDS01 [Anthostomella pinea]|uniref:Endoglucanase EG-II n=1 Tax=Anthostomella pinea TaxID=933095 RepID=A0AAI8VT58_9PEZI|nr:Uu.00g061690.m01.CDS01 [Anthostomella pinea]
MRFSSVSCPAYPVLLSFLCLASTTLASDSDKTTSTAPCTASSTSGAFFDLRPDVAVKPKADGSKSNTNGAPLEDYKARGYDYGSNFTLNICGPVAEHIEDVKGIEESKWQNISAYYKSQGDYYSLGFQSGELITRGKELVLQYSGGSPCGKKKSSSASLAGRSAVHKGAAYRDYDTDDEAPSATNTTGIDTARDSDEPVRRKSTTIFFSCDRDPAASSAQVAFIATDPEECSYIFKVKSRHACAGAEPHKPGSVGPGSVFLIILAIAILVYLLGGIFYQRAVANARGWKQLPNYSLWASVWSFICSFTLLGLARAAVAKVQFLGVAIAGGDFGCQTDGSCPTSSVQLALGKGPGQMQHFVEDDGMNILRLPTSWQFLVNNQLAGDLNDSNLAQYDQLMQACLDTGAYCMIDIHNFARWDRSIIGQGGPTDDQFASLWSQLATKYASNDKVVFELMNEPHALDVGIWAQTCQAAVTAIRKAGAASHMILLSGNNFDSAATLVTDGSADALMAITNPDGKTDGLLLDIHKYLDEDNSGTHAKCTTDNVDAFTAVAEYLRKRGRQGFVSETGSSSDASCFTSFCAQNTFINANSDVFVGLIGWGAGSFDTSYVLSLTPSEQNGALVDTKLMSQCLIAPWANSSETITTPTSAASSSAAVSNTIKLSTVETSSLLLTVTQSGSTLTALATASGTPAAHSGLAAASDDGSRVAPSTSTSSSSSAAETSAPATGAASSMVSGGFLLWCGVLLAASCF